MSRRLPDRKPTRLVIDRIVPEVDGGRFAAKAIVGDHVQIAADAFCDGRDRVTCEVRFRRVGAPEPWLHLAMTPLDNDRFVATLEAGCEGTYEFSIRARVDVFRTWLEALDAMRAASMDLSALLEDGGVVLSDAARRAKGAARRELNALARAVVEEQALPDALFDGRAVELVDAHVQPAAWTSSERRELRVERAGARFSAWYELFPRSAASRDDVPGRLADVEARLEYIANLGFDVVYLPPIHPIGLTNRKGPSGATTAGVSDPGSPWAIGASEGGHTAVHPELGTVEDVDHLVHVARSFGLEIALDLAFQCSPDHPWVTTHPEWFRHRADGSIAYAENPPKRYEDIYPLDFDGPEWRALWEALLEVVLFWVSHGIATFRVDNPHTKPFAFWEWLIGEVQREHPAVVFLAEAFTRPSVMYHLAKLGFSQSYTYFAWRSSASELQSYLEELTSEPVISYFRPNFWPNTPDILSAELQSGLRPAFASRALLAATLSASYGIYGPVFELAVSGPRPGTEEYARSEKYEVLHHDLEVPESLAPLLRRLNEIRREHVAMWSNDTLRFHASDNPELLVYSKTPSQTIGAVSGATIEATSGASRWPVLVVANLDPRHVQSGWVTVDPRLVGTDDNSPLEVEDLLTGARYRWARGQNFVILDPAVQPAHVFRVKTSGTTP